MARRYRYAIIKKKEARKGKLSVGLAIASLLLFGAAVGTGLCTRRQLRIYCRRNLPFCHTAFGIWISDGNRKFFRRKL